MRVSIPYHTSRGYAPPPGSASNRLLGFLDEFLSNHHSSVLKINVKLVKASCKVGITLRWEVSRRCIKICLLA